MSTQKIRTHSGMRDRLFSEEIYRFVREYQNIRVRVTPENVEERVFVLVHPPYMSHSVSLIDIEGNFKQLKERHRTRLLRVREARVTAPEKVREFLDKQFYETDGKEKHMASGRGELSEIKALMQTAVDVGVIPISGYKKHPNGCDLRKWLKKHGVGIDCSGFVQQALKRLIDVSRVEVGETPGRKSELDEVFLRCGWVFEDITDNAINDERVYEEITTPAQARPGDVLVSRSHMRIMVRVGVVKDDGIVFEVAESTSARDTPSEQVKVEDDIGPRIIQVKYPRPSEPISKQNPMAKRLVDDDFSEDRSENEYVIGRCREIEQLWKKVEIKHYLADAASVTKPRLKHTSKRNGGLQ